MILDTLGEFADATSVGTPNATTVNVGSSIDLIVARDIGNGEPLYLVIQVDTAITGTTSTVAFWLSSDSTSTLSVDGTQTTHYKSDTIAEATLVAGYQLVVPVPQASPAFERYLGFQIAEVGGNVLTAGKVNAFLTREPANWTAYAEGTN